LTNYKLSLYFTTHLNFAELPKLTDGHIKESVRSCA